MFPTSIASHLCNAAQRVSGTGRQCHKHLQFLSDSGRQPYFRDEVAFVVLPAITKRCVLVLGDILRVRACIKETLQGESRGLLSTSEFTTPTKFRSKYNDILNGKPTQNIDNDRMKEK